MNLAQKFRANYLNTHEKYLKSIADVITWSYGNRVRSVSEGILNKIEVDQNYFNQIGSSWKGDEEKAFRNLRNSWYHECALRYPFEAEGIDRMKFAPWKIIQFYYVIYTASSAIVRCYDNSEQLSHVKVMNILTSNIIMQPKLGIRFFVPPFGICVKKGDFAPSCKDSIEWEYGRKNHCPNIEECLLRTYEKRNKNVTLLHYFKDLREWVNYEDAYLFISLYGPKVISNLNYSLLKISNAFNTLSDTFLINFYGFDKVYSEFEMFEGEINGHLKVDPEFLRARFELYNKL